jgi:chromosome segregation protein
MFLKRLELVGFKSFATRTITDLLPGIVVVVGPNGSGKTNIADGVRWVLGEQSARAVRARRPEEVIFAGSAARQPLGMAEVSLVLDNSDGTLPVEYGEVRVSRRLYRSGESEYLLNGARVRLRDITQQLLHAGLGTDTYSVIGQGAVDELILQRPEERRVAFESAADIRRHQLKLADTRSRLASTEANLVRVQDVIAELAPHVRRLKTQVERAGRAEGVRAELHDLLLCAFRIRLRRARAAREVADRDLTAATERLQHAESETRAAEERLSADARLLVAREAEQAEIRPRAQTLREQAQAAERGLAVTRERLAATTEQHASAQQEHERLTQQLERLTQDVLPDEPEAPTGDAAELIALRARLERELAPALEAAQRTRAEALLQRERVEHQISQAELRLARYADQLRQAEAAQAVQAAREADRRARIAVLEARLPRLVEEHATLQQILDTARSELAAAGAARREAAEQVERAREASRAANQQADRLQGALATLGAPDHPSAPRAELPEEWRAALHGIEVVGLAGELATRARPIDRLLRGYLLRTLVVRDAAAAREAHRRLSDVVSSHAPAWAILSLDGLLLGAPGEHPVERAATKAGSALADWRRQIETYQADLRLAEQRRAAAEAVLATAWAAMETAERDERAARARIAELEGQVQPARRTEASATAELARLRAEQTRATEPAARPSRTAESDQKAGAAAAEQARDELASARHTREAVVEHLRLVEAEANALSERVAGVRARLSALEAAEAQRQAEQEARSTLRARIQSELDETRLARQTAEQRLALLAGQASELAKRESELVEEERTTLLEIGPLEEQLASAEQHRLELIEGRRTLEQQLVTLRAAERSAHVVREEPLVASQRAEDDLDLLKQEMTAAAELSGEDPGSADWIVHVNSEPHTAEEDLDLHAASRRITVLQRELRGLGGVAETVVEEYRELGERHDFLQAQAQDLTQAMAELGQATEELEASMRQRFSEVFEATQRAFEGAFKRLFGGGEAQLVLTDPSDPLHSGIDIVARPPGKKLQNLLALSGGERALTVVALLFGLLDVNPTPFCVLDEVDAALDDSNVQRFADLLADFSRRIQFIVVTHNRATMDKADALYGVTMDAQGVSHIFSVQPRGMVRA